VSIFLVRRFLLVGVCLTLSACVNHERRYDFEGRVVSRVLATRTLVVDHENIRGFMPAMTMPYPVANGVDLSGVEAGDRIKARIVVHPDERYELDKVLVTDSTHRGQTEKETRQLYPGEPIPDVELLNQDGKTIRLSDFRGKTVLLTFFIRDVRCRPFVHA